MAIETHTKYVNKDDYKTYFGVDLDLELPDLDNASNKSEMFLMRVENELSAFLDSQFYRNVDKEYPEFSDYQKDHYHLALLYQAQHMIKNGDIGSDSGYDADKGEIVSDATIKAKQVGNKAKQQLILCGLWCCKIINKRRTWEIF